MKIWTGALLIAAMLMVSGCFDMPSVYSPCTDQSAVAEPRLVGAWQTADGKEQMFVKLTGDREYRLTYLDDDGEATLWKLRVAKLGGTPVADLTLAKNDNSIIPAHHFVALSFEGATLKAWFLDSGALRETAGKEGLGYIRGKKDEVVLTAQTSDIAAFLEKNLAGEMKRSPDQEFLPMK